MRISGRKLSAIGLTITLPATILSLFMMIGGAGGVLAQSIPPDTYSGMQWRLVGPLRAGWATVAEGVPDSANTFYFGTAGGGVWKTIDAGRTWQPLMQHESASSIGALVIAPSNANILYVGTGQVDYRYDILSGDGVFKSTDAGNTWMNVGLNATRHIGRIVVDPHDPQRVLVAALGNIFMPGPDRGVFLTTDGGKKWERVLFVDDSTGGVDLASDPLQSSTVYAALWQVRMRPWLDYFEEHGGPGSGIYKSVDGGEHWQRVKGNGLPSGPLGRIGLGVARGLESHILYATIEAPKEGSGVYRSDDGGQNWRLVNGGSELASSYFGRVTVDPKNADVVYVMGRSISRSTDGGKNFTFFVGAPGGDDYHFLWINPNDPTHMITGADQGAVVTVNGGKSWSSWYNQPTGQFYRLAADDRFPYSIYSSQQDNGTVKILGRGPYGVIEERDWHPVGADERDCVIPKPGNPDMVFGSGLGGRLTRFDEVTRQSAEVSPWPISSYAARPTSVRYRYTWITPLAFSPLPPYPLYMGAQVLFRSTDDGNRWEIVSPDLSGKVEGATNCENPDLTGARACGYGVIFAIAPSPLAAGVIWVGTDDGLIQLTTDEGKHWHNVTPPAVPLWARVDAIAPSPFSARGAYAAVNTHRLGQPAPLILKTSDSGEHWKVIVNGLPRGEYVNVVRADPERNGLLYAGTDRGVRVSFDDGDHWQSLSMNLPTASVRDLLVHAGDLIAATQGRGIWVLDDLAPLREVTAAVARESARLFRPAPAWRLRGNENHDTPWPASTALGQNPADGAIIDYWLKDGSKDPVTLAIRDGQGKTIRAFSSEQKPDSLNATRYFPEAWVGNPRQPATSPGMHRFVWDLRYPRPGALSYDYSIAAVWGEGTPLDPQGPLVLPGEYTVVLNVNGKDYSRSLEVKLDPRVRVSATALEQQLDLARKIGTALEQGVSSYREIETLMKEKAKSQSALGDTLSVLADKGNPNMKSVLGSLASLVTAVQSADAAPTQGQRDAFALYGSQLDGLVVRWSKFKDGKLNEKKD